MARLRPTSLPKSLLALLGVALIASGTSASVSPDLASSPSPREEPPTVPSDKPDLICHTTDPSECYPRVFQPTDDFQIVHDDQDLPQGLHVRLNIQTGQKEAKINVPDEIPPSLEGLPVDSAVVLVDPDSSSEPPKIPKIPANAPPYDPAGKIKEPPSGSSSSDDAHTFHQSLSILKKGLDIDSALLFLSEIAHDIYYGLKLSEDYATVRSLFCLAASSSSPSSPSPESPSPDSDSESDKSLTPSKRAHLSAKILSSALQNNPKSLFQIQSHWPALQRDPCISHSWLRPLAKDNAPLTKARIAALSGLLRSDVIRASFLAQDGMQRILEILVFDSNNNEEWNPVRKQAAFLVLDNFLDEDMGAALGEWPTAAAAAQASDAECAAADKNSIRAECWDWHVKQLVARLKADKGHWSRELQSKLNEQRKANTPKRKGKEEL
ncbi:hypothetical protein QBC47DRAFT_373980 [Echria macrotheca]|uniref:Nucleotide exchange factor SIL1 n=1 Tax=Echria macrotheca TaxID=438768 RepID=A0AAJ0BJX6_9PEZI|nr:hypothetical protein QBC47DRAFT_373980 [Echria macrotheca]